MSSLVTFLVVPDLMVLLAVNVVLWAWVVLVPPVVLRVRRLHFGASGLALPGVIVIAEENAHGFPPEVVIRHEIVHQAQFRRYTPVGAAVLLGWHYGLGVLRARCPEEATLRHLWQNHPLENEANAAMTRTDPLPRLIGWPRTPSA